MTMYRGDHFCHLDYYTTLRAVGPWRLSSYPIIGRVVILSLQPSHQTSGQSFQLVRPCQSNRRIEIAVAGRSATEEQQCPSTTVYPKKTTCFFSTAADVFCVSYVQIKKTNHFICLLCWCYLGENQLCKEKRVSEGHLLTIMVTQWGNKSETESEVLCLVSCQFLFSLCCTNFFYPCSRIFFRIDRYPSSFYCLASSIKELLSQLL